jgi:hypothetical protein
MDYLALGDALEEPFSFIHQQTKTPNANKGQRDGNRFQVGGNDEADTTAP